jgi:hypothetical protein
MCQPQISHIKFFAVMSGVFEINPESSQEKPAGDSKIASQHEGDST